MLSLKLIQPFSPVHHLHAHNGALQGLEVVVVVVVVAVVVVVVAIIVVVSHNTFEKEENVDNRLKMEYHRQLDR